ncbi:hypothetical protein F7725_016888 [Dissostichus mawsoni]|uniref:Migration and invasion inhibitory protein n=1 Tax=Dissostichus mawsoni TaxID=36200 RepID=A0A7J5Z2V2_DISMA|nr:hypothetical protein F7725_016888 [Dissostichus mawsoni]
MSSTDRVDILRELNKDLLNQLKQQREKLERLSGCRQSRKREREDEERRDPEENRTVTRGGQGSSRAGLAKPTVRFSDTCERRIGTQSSVSTPSCTSEHKKETAQHTTSSDLFKDSNNVHPLVHSRLQDMRPAITKSCLVNHSKEQGDVQSRVTFQSDEYEEISSSDRHHLQPLLGYDWIAGVLDAEDSLIERSDEFFNDLRTFRSLNKDDCVHIPQAEFPEEYQSVLPPLTNKHGPEASTDTHQCKRVRSLTELTADYSPSHFTLRRAALCAKSSNPQILTLLLIQLSSGSAFLAPPSCLLTNTKLIAGAVLTPLIVLGYLRLVQHSSEHAAPPSSLDLRSSLVTSENKELEDLSSHKVSENQVSDVSRLARHNFQHFSSKRKLGSTFYPLH